MTDDAYFRRPSEADHEPIIRRFDDWAAGRKARHLLQRLWFRHFTGTSWIAARQDDRPIGVAIGFVSPDDPATAILHVVAVDPAHRRRGIGRELVKRAVADASERGATRVRTTAWPDDHPMIAFLESVGFQILVPIGGQRLYGTPARADFDEPGDDRTELELLIRGAGSR